MIAKVRAEMQPELWVRDVGAAVDFYERAFGAEVEHWVGGRGEPEGVAQLSVDGACFWLANASEDDGRLSAAALGGATGRTLLVAERPESVVDTAVAAGARLTGAVAREHGWLLGRIVDPFGHEWEVGRPLGGWPPRSG